MAPQDERRRGDPAAGAPAAGDEENLRRQQELQRRQDEEGAHKKELYPMVNWKYDLFLYVIGNLVDLFFREVVPRGSWRVPQSGPVLFVAAPHANQVSERPPSTRTRDGRVPMSRPRVPLCEACIIHVIADIPVSAA